MGLNGGVQCVESDELVVQEAEWCAAERQVEEPCEISEVG